MGRKDKTLHELILTKQWEDVDARLTKAPHEIRQRAGTKWGGSCLADAISYGAPPEITMKLLRAYPKAIRFADENDEYPMFKACAFGAPVEAFEIMTLVFPEVLAMKRRNIFKKGTPAQWCKWQASAWPNEYAEHKDAIIELLSKDVSYWKAQQVERASTE